MRKKWSKKEIELLEEKYYESIDLDLNKLFPDRTLYSINLKAKRVNLFKSEKIKFENRRNAKLGSKNGMYGKTSSRQGKSYVEFYGIEKAIKVKEKLSIQKTGSIGMLGETNPMFGKTPWNKNRKASKEEKLKYSEAQKKYWRELNESDLKKRKEQLRNDWIKKRNKYSEIDTIPEIIVETILKRFNVLFEKKKTIGYYNCDFVIGEHIIEVQGDYWHGNPNKYVSFDKIQTKNINRDKRKLLFLKNKNYKILYLWEFDLKNNINLCKKHINKFINENK